LHGWRWNRVVWGDSREATSPMPNKHNAPRRHRIPKMKFSVKNWAEYDAGLRRRGSLTLWVTSEVLDGWQATRRTTPGGQPIYSGLAIETALLLRMAFHLALRQTEGLIASIFVLLDVPLSTPDHTTLSRRAKAMESISKRSILPDGPIHLLIDSTGLKVFGAGEWLQEKHGAKARRKWKKLHLAVDADTGMVMASTLTGNDVGDPSQVAPLLDQIETTIASVTADGAYDGMRIYEVIAAHSEDARVIIPPHMTAVLSAKAKHNPSQRDQHILSIAARGRLGWQEVTNYGQRALVETAMGRYKAIIGPRLRARSLGGQQAEAAVSVAVLNRMLYAGRPDSVRRLNIAA
jgi:Transposase DDE domain